ncbi:unnamed protein product [Clonostachys rhizophaga]|uniref:Chromatin remodeling factor mit1 n=1 Tax=Clonostachys rhizophaga TaxID=160324 RepID=A0A9N9YPI6_9HYPO|nr:unnamed protein product [Clonostachys rhizophaga]
MSESVPGSSPSPSLRHQSVELADVTSPTMDRGQGEPATGASVHESSPSPSLRNQSVELADTASPGMGYGQGEPTADAPIREISVSSTLNQTVLDIVDTANLATNSDDEDSMSLDTAGPKQQNTQIHVELRPLPSHLRAQYVNTQSDIVERVIQEEVLENGEVKYLVEFTDGREEQHFLLTQIPKVDHSTLNSYETGAAALMAFYQPANAGKRKRSDDDNWISDSDSVGSDLPDFDQNEELDIQSSPDVISRQSRLRSLRPGSSRQSSHAQHSPSDLEDEKSKKDLPTRTLRARPQKIIDYRDELAGDPIPQSDGDDDPPFITSDIVQAKAKTRRSRLQQRSQRLSRRPKPSNKRRSPDSDIEFEAPRRSSRATRNQLFMQDGVDEDDAFEIVDDKGQGAPRVISIREIFQPSDSAFVSVHMETCHTCNGTKNKGQLVHCQGCSLSYHKNCLGFRSGREHMVTKVGEENFVLQCRFCIGVHGKKDRIAPKYGTCQDCHTDGKACAPFSSKKTARQEEKLRDENGGVDPITPVSETLLNNADLVLFRCKGCHRGWHLKHLPPHGDGSTKIGTDLRAEQLKDYSIDWLCNDCGLMTQKIHRLVAWRPTKQSQSSANPDSPVLLHSEVSEDKKEYLVKWENLSYAHCSWKPGAWVYGVVAPTSRVSFAKRDAERSLMSMNEKDAIPDEYLMPEIILDIKMASSAPKPNSKEEQLASVSHIRKIFVKYQGLSYDDVVWASPPTKDMEQHFHEAFLSAFCDYVEGKYFNHEPYSKIRDRVNKYKEAEFTEVDVQPAGLTRGKLMGYQLEGLNWLLGNYHGNRSVVLADEMGLGKTVQVVSLVASLVQDSPKCWPFLIVVPNATCPNWRREFKQWTPELRVVTYHGGKIPQDLAYKYELFPGGSTEMKAHVVIMSYDSAADPQTRILFKPVHWAGLVVDEGQRLKNDQNLLYLALMAMKIPFRVLLTGTPLQNNKRELFNLIQFIDETQDAAELDEQYQVLDKETLPKLHEQIRPYFLRRTKAGVLKFLPPMAQIIVPLTMTVIQEKLSKSILAKNPQLIKAMFANTKISKKERGSLNNILMQLRKCLCHPFVYSDAIEERHHDPEIIHQNLVQASSKLILLELMLPKLKERGHRVLIFSQFLDQLNIVEDFLTGMGYGFRRLDGTISSLEKQRRIDAFNAPDSELFAFLLSTRAGGVGINLATADTVIIMDPDFNPHQDLQALSRAHRIGQKKKVLCFQLVTKDSAEERIMQIGRKKMALDHALIETMDDQDIDGDDLESIIKHGAQALFSDDYQKTAIRYDSASVDKLLDRSEMDQEMPDQKEEGSTEQFNFAKVWSNDASGFQDSLGLEESEAPEPINSSVWDQILAQREEEARKQAEANREVLGRGGRRRMAKPINYKPVTIAQATGAESQGSSDEFSGSDTPDESEDDEAVLSKGRRKPTPTQTITPASTPTKKGPPKSSSNNTQQQKSAQKSLNSNPKKPVQKTANGEGNETRTPQNKHKKQKTHGGHTSHLLTPPRQSPKPSLESRMASHPKAKAKSHKASPSSVQTAK